MKRLYKVFDFHSEDYLPFLPFTQKDMFILVRQNIYSICGRRGSYKVKEGPLFDEICSKLFSGLQTSSRNLRCLGVSEGFQRAHLKLLSGESYTG